MTNECLIRQESGKLSSAAHVRMLSLPHEPLFLADWQQVLMIHYEVETDDLQTVVPFELDRWDGRAFVSLVAFTMQRMRPRIGGRLTELLFRPIATHEFLNVRTYVRHNGESGIFFLAEWLSNRLSVTLGPWAFGLPYRFGRIRYGHNLEEGESNGLVEDRAGRGKLDYSAIWPTGMERSQKPLKTVSTGRGGALTQLKLGVNEKSLSHSAFEPCEVGSLEEWLMERYTAFTCSSGKTRRFFRVWHKPWQQIPLMVELKDQSLLERNWPFFREPRLVGGNFSPGVKDVWMGWPHRVGTD